jgi:1,4-alpha-glucan branching enzyme
MNTVSTQLERSETRYDFSLLTDFDLHLFNEGTHDRLYEKFGAHPGIADGERGTFFAVWAPNANAVSVIGDHNEWNRDVHRLRPRESSGIWEGFVPGVEPGAIYKYYVSSRFLGYHMEKADPFAFWNEIPPQSASIVRDLGYEWGDQEWQQSRRQRNGSTSPMSIYEIHLGSWMRVPEEGNRWLTYREVAPKLAEYLNRMGFTHAEFLPLMEHPFYGSWGYQVTGYFAPTSRYGTPQDFMYLVDCLHQHNIGVILDWVPSHFPSDGHGLSYFDGTHLFEHEDPRQGFHPEWTSYIFNYGRNEVRSFLLSSAMFWLDRYHIDGLRVDAVASLLYLDYARNQGEWIPNQYGGNENLEAISFLQQLNRTAYRHHPDIQTIAEESTAWPMVSRPTHVGGLGFGLKWDMGWMHDTLKYLSKDPIHRKYHHNRLTFRGLYMFTENYVLPLSHDEVVHGKGSLIGRMPGDEWQQFANLRLLFGYQWAQPGKKLLFMGGEFGQKREWTAEESLEWWVLEFPLHSGVQTWVQDLNRLYRNEPALHEREFDPGTFQWLDADDADTSVLSFLRRGHHEILAVIGNFTPVLRRRHRIGVPEGGYWRELLNSDAACYGGSNQGNGGGVIAEATPSHGQPFSLDLTLPPSGILFLKPQR